MLLLILLLALVGRAAAQTVIMPAIGSGDTTMSYALVYDDGGPNGAHSSSCNVTYTFHTVDPNGRYSIIVNHSLTHPAGNAQLQIFDGTGTDGYIIGSFPPYGSAQFYSNSNSVTLRFVADDDMPTAGFEVELCEFHNIIPTTVDLGFLDSNTIFIKWNEPSPSIQWIFEYAIVCDSTFLGIPGQFLDPSTYNTILADTCYYEFPNVPVGYYLVYRIYTEDTSSCMRMCEGVGSPYKEEEECPCVLAQNCGFEEVPGGVVFSWDYDADVEYWNLSYMGIDTTVDGNVTQVFIPYEFPCFAPSLYINGNCTVYCKGANYNFPAGGCHRTVGTIYRMYNTGTTIYLRWFPTGMEGDRYELYCREGGMPEDSNVLLATFDYDEDSYLVTGLKEHTSYRFEMWVICGGVERACSPVATYISTTIDNCIDFINLLDQENVHRTWGSYEDPLHNAYGSQGRHTPILDSSLTDPNTGGALRCVPPGEEVSFKLGDANVGAQAETITYDYLVDSLDKDMLVLRYAVVLQNPNHTVDNQPYFSMEILDGNGEIVDTTCCHARFAADGSLGWNTVAGSNVIWKDWSTVGIDIAPYHGQQIKIRFTTKDCADGGHYGYAYFTIHCDSKRIALVNLCDHDDSVRLRAPEGFEYQWTHGDDTTVISTENEILVPVDSSIYHCHATFIGKEECSFDIHSLAILPVPVAAMRYAVDTCRQQLLLYGDCYVGIDSVYLPYVRQVIDSVTWTVDGQSHQGDTLVVPLDGNRWYHINLSCKLSGSDCRDEIADSVWIDVFRQLLIEGDTQACHGDTVMLVAQRSDPDEMTLMWSDGTLADTLVAIANSNLSYYAVTSFWGCTDTVYSTINVYPVYSDTLEAAICNGEVFDSLGFSESQTGFYTHSLLSVYGCDSICNLALVVFPTYDDTIVAAYCDSAFASEGFEADSTGFYTHRFVTANGCDSVRHLDFVRFEVFSDTIVEEIYWGDIYTGYGFVEREKGFYQQVFVDGNGCDSVYSLQLNVVLLSFPNAVTPNGDGYNDRFVIVGLLEASLFDYVALSIYDRWGRRVFYQDHFSQPSDFWDPNNPRFPDGTYFYHFVARSLSHQITHKGVVEVIR